MVTRTLAATGVFLVLVGMVVASIWPAGTAQAAINNQINFQGKLVNSNGTNIANGTYNMQFKLYTAGDGCVPGGSVATPCGGTLQWTESWLRNNSQGVTVTDGVFQVNLGSITALPAIFNNNTIWLSINLGNTNATCTPFTSCVGDGEMLPFIRFTAAPYALNSDLLDGLDSTDFAQLNPGSAQSGSINVTGSVQAATSLQAPLVDTATAVALSIGTATATSVTIGKVTTPFLVQGNSTSTFTGKNGSFTTTVGFTTPTANNSLSFPDAGGTICTTVAATCSATYAAAAGGGYLNKNATDTSSFAVTAANYLYGFTNSNGTPTTGGVLKLDNGANTGSTLLVTASGNPGATKALIAVNNTAGSPSGNLIDLQVGGVSKFAVDTVGAVTASGAVTAGTYNGQTVTSTASFTGTVTTASTLTVTAGGLTVTAGGETITAGNLNVVAGKIQTAATDRIANNGDLVNIGNITGTAGITVATTGSGTGNALALQPAGGSSLTAAVTKNAATGNEIGYDLALTVNKATSGNYTGIKLNVTESSAPGAANLLMDLQAGAASKFSVTNGGAVATAGIITPGAVGSANTSTYLCRNGSNQIATCSTGLSGSAFIQGGNSFTAAGDLGTNDAYDLNLRTNSATRLTITSLGNFQIAAGGSRTLQIGQAAAAGDSLTIKAGQGASGANDGGDLVLQGGARGTSGTAGSVIARSNGTNSTTAFMVQNATSNSVLIVDTQNSRVGINLGGTTAPAATLEVNGALRLSGSSVDTFSTPLGASVGTKINIPIYSPGNFGQLVAMGLPNCVTTTDLTANCTGGSGQVAATARGLVVLDARHGNTNSTHQPSIGVFSYDENQIAGLSWEGTATTISLKNSANNVNLQGNGVDILKAQNQTGTAAVGIGMTPVYVLDVNGDANITSGSSYRIGGTPICASTGCTASTASAILNQNSAQQASSNFWISGTGRADTKLLTPTLDTATAVALNIGTSGGPTATAINLNQDTSVATGKNLSLASGTGTFSQTYTGTATDAHSITANSLTTGTALKVTSASNTAANTSWSAVSLNPTNAQSGTAVSGANLISGLDVQFTQNPTVAGNNETVANFAVKQIDTSVTDNTVNSIVNIANNDTATGNQITATNGLLINGANLTNGINFSAVGTDITTGTNEDLTLAPNGSGKVVIGGTTPTVTTSGATALLVDAGGAAALNLATGNSTTVNIGSVGSTVKATAVHIADTSDATNTQAVTIGSTATNANNIAIIQGGSNTTQAIQLLPNTAGGIMIGAAAGTGTITLGQSTATNTVNIGTANRTSATQTVAIGNGTSATSGGVSVSIANGTPGSSTTNTVAIGTGGTTTGTVGITIGSNGAAAHTTVLQGGNGTGATAAIRLSPADAGDINIGTTTQTGQITVGQADTTNTISVGSANRTAHTQTITIGNGTSTTSGGVSVQIANSIPGASTTNTVAIGTAGTTTGTVGVTIGSIGAAAHTTVLQGGNGTGASAAIKLSVADAGDINIGTTTQTGQITVGQADTTNTISIGSVNRTAHTQTINIGNGTSTTSGGVAVNIANSIPGASTANTVAIGTAGTTTGTVGITIGSIGAAAHTTVIQGGNGTGATAAIRLSPADAGDINIGTATQTGQITVGQADTTNTISIGSVNRTAHTQTITIGNGTSTTSGGVSVQIANSIPGASTTNTVAIGAGGTTTGLVGVTLGSIGNAAHTTVIQGGSSAGATTAIALTPQTTGTIVIGAAAGTGQITVGSSSTTQTVVVGNGAGAATVSIANAGTAGNTVNIAGAATANGITDTVNIATGNAAASGFKVVHIADGTPGGTGTNTVTMGSLANASTTTIQGGSGNINLNTNQTGAGITVRTLTNNSVNAFQVQDSAGTSNTIVASTVNSKVGLGTATPGANTGLTTARLEIADANGTNSDLALRTAGGGSSTIFQAAGRNTLGSPTISVNGDIYGEHDFAGYNGSGYSVGAAIQGASDGTITGTAMPGKLVFKTTPTGSITPAVVHTLSSTGAAFFKNSSNSTTAFQIQSSTSDNLLVVDSSGGNSNLASGFSNQSMESGNPPTGWSTKGTTPTTFAQDATQHYDGANSLKVTTQATANQGAKYNITLTDSTAYSVSFYIKLDSASTGFATMQAGYSSDGSTDNTACAQNTSTVITNGWTQVSCTFTTPASHSGTPFFYIKQTDAVIHTFYIDAMLIQTDPNYETNFRQGKLTLQATVTSPLILQNPTNSSSALAVQNSAGTNIFGVDTTDTNIITNPGMEVNSTGWAAQGGTTAVARDTSQAWLGVASLRVATSATASAGAKFVTGNAQPTQLAISSTYTISWYAKRDATAFTDMIAAYDVDGTGAGAPVNCTGINTQTVSNNGWTRFTCQIVTTGSAPAATAYVFIMQTAGTARTFYIDGVQLELAGGATPYGAGSISLNGVIKSPVALQNAADSTTAFQIQNAASTMLLVADTLNGVVKVGATTGSPTLSSAVIFATNGEFSGRLIVGSMTAGVMTNGADFNTARSATDAIYTGTQRPQKHVILAPEFPGAAMTAQNSCTTCIGSMTSDVEPAAGAANLSSAEGYAHSLYSWSTTQASAQNYDIWATYMIPADFSAFTSNTPFTLWTKSTDTTNGTVTLQVYNATRTPAYCYGGASDTPTSLTPTSANTWQKKTVGDLTAGGCSWTSSPNIAAGDRIMLRFRVQAAASGGVTKIGELEFDYLAKF